MEIRSPYVEDVLNVHGVIVKRGEDSMENLPEGYKDAIYVESDIFLSLIDKIKLFFGWRFSIRAVTFCEERPGKVYSEVKARVYRTHKLSRGSGQMEIKKDDKNEGGKETCRRKISSK
jgi:hypothetical protein